MKARLRAFGFADWVAAIYIDGIDEPNRRGGFLHRRRLLWGAQVQALPDGSNPCGESQRIAPLVRIVFFFRRRTFYCLISTRLLNGYSLQ
jgi:hypothetical protein